MGRNFRSLLSDEVRIFFTLAHRRNFWIVVLIDIGLVCFAHLLAYLVRFDLAISDEFKKILSVAPLLIFTKIPIFYTLGLYRGMWRYTSIADLINISKAVVLSSGLIILLVLYFNRFGGFSRSVFFLDGVFTFLFLGFS